MMRVLRKNRIVIGDREWLIDRFNYRDTLSKILETIEIDDERYFYFIQLAICETDGIMKASVDNVDFTVETLRG